MQISEKDFEDWVCGHLEEVTGMKGERLLGRQVRLPTGGILDVLSAHWGRWDDGVGQIDLTVIELKAELIDAAAVCQILGYMGGLEECIYQLNQRERDRGADRTYVTVCGIVAAPEITTEAAWMLRALENVRYVWLRTTISAQKSWAAELDIHVANEEALGKAVAFFDEVFPTFRPATDQVAEQNQ